MTDQGSAVQAVTVFIEVSRLFENCRDQVKCRDLVKGAVLVTQSAVVSKV